MRDTLTSDEVQKMLDRSKAANIMLESLGLESPEFGKDMERICTSWMEQHHILQGDVTTACHAILTERGQPDEVAEGEGYPSLQDRITTVLDELQETKECLEETKTRNRKLLLAVKKFLGFKNWPAIQGDFLDGVIALLKAKTS